MTSELVEGGETIDDVLEVNVEEMGLGVLQYLS